ncbi:MAG: aminotransferase class IV [Tissierellia bacterium]|nr:aminotransferase class IV [Tissierellia bacterium]
MNRMEKTAISTDRKISRGRSELREDIEKLVFNNDIINTNIKLIVTHIAGVDSFIIYEMISEPRNEDLKNEGIHTVLYDYERENPNVKILNTDFKEEVKAYYDSKNATEALLRNAEGGILEGSRTNLYFIKDGKIYTPESKSVLIGITRTKVIEIIKSKGYEIVECTINTSDLDKVDAAFISGTTVDVLPIKSIEDIVLNSQDNPIVKDIIEGFEEEKIKSLNGK